METHRPAMRERFSGSLWPKLQAVTSDSEPYGNPPSSHARQVFWLSEDVADDPVGVLEEDQGREADEGLCVGSGVSPAVSVMVCVWGLGFRGQGVLL